MSHKKYHGYAKKLANKTSKKIKQPYIAEELGNIERKKIFHTYASFEMLAHSLVYELADEVNPGANTYEILDDEGKPHQYHAIKLMTFEKGLVGFVFVPHDQDQTNPQMHVVFRGTSDFYSVIRDLEHGGAGSQSFNEQQEFILQQINDHVRNLHLRTKKKIKLSISGHSLGGGDAQNCAASIIKAMAHNVDEDHHHRHYKSKFNKRVRADLKHIEKIKIGHLNSAGVAHATAKECAQDLEFLMKNTTQHKPKISLHGLLVEKDLIQQTGQTSLLNNVDPQYAHVEIIHARIPEKWYSPTNFINFLADLLINSRIILASLSSQHAVSFAGNMIKNMNIARETLKAHSSFHFIKDNEHQMDYYTNNSETGHKLVGEHLNKKIALENSQVSIFLKSALRRTLKMRA